MYGDFFFLFFLFHFIFFPLVYRFFTFRVAGWEGCRDGVPACFYLFFFFLLRLTSKVAVILLYDDMVHFLLFSSAGFRDRGKKVLLRDGVTWNLGGRWGSDGGRR